MHSRGRGHWIGPGVLVSAALLMLIAACSSSPSSAVRTPAASTASGPPSSSAPTITSPTVPSPAPSASAPAARHPRLVVVPAAGLHDKQVVRLSAAGFTPGEALQIVECAQKGAATGPGDCNLANLLGVTSDSAGRVSSDFQVATGPFGANHIICSARVPCLISVTQASLAPTEEADALISFAIVR